MNEKQGTLGMDSLSYASLTELILSRVFLLIRDRLK